MKKIVSGKFNVFKKINIASKFKGLSKKRKIIVATTGVVVLGGIGVAVMKMNSDKQMKPTIETVVAKRGELQTYVDTVGKVDSLKVKKFFSPVTAKVSNVSVKEGDEVQSGSKIVTYDLTTLLSNNQKALLALKASELGLEDAVSKANIADEKVSKAQSELSFYKEAIEMKQVYIEALQRKQDLESNPLKSTTPMGTIEGTSAEIDTLNDSLRDANLAQSDLSIKKDELTAQLDSAIQSGDTAKEAELNAQISSINDEMRKMSRNIVQLESKLSRANNELNTIKKNTEKENAARPSKMQTTIDLQRAQSELQDLQSKYSSRLAIVENATPSLTSASKQQLIIDSNLKELDVKDSNALIAEGRKGIYSDLKGVISQLNVFNGSEVTQGQELFSVSGLDDLIVKININKQDLGKLKDGQNAVVNIAGKEFNGKVLSISKMATKNEKGNTLITGTISIVNPDDSILLGLDAKVKVTSEKVSDSIILPTDAINISNDGSFVYVLKNNKIKKAKVKTGISTTSKIVVISGVEEGDEVITDIGDYKVGDTVVREGE